MLNRTMMTPELYEYLLAKSGREPEIARRLRVETSKMPEAEMLVPPEEGQFLNLLVSITGAKKALEVGVFTGYSALWTALALPADGVLVACDVSEEWTAIAQRYWEEAGVAHKIQLRLGPASDTLAELLRTSGEGSFDFAFLDADKANYCDYYAKTFALVRPRGLIVIDNVLRAGEVLDPNPHDPGTIAVRRLNDELAKDNRVRISMLPVGDGITLVTKLGSAHA
jgi:predicted O-methyltransferase YrrM